MRYFDQAGAGEFVAVATDLADASCLAGLVAALRGLLAPSSLEIG
jgi:hypothetical protein